MRNIDLVVIHCSATPQNRDIGAAEIREWHVKGNNWRDIGYHYVVRRNGLVEVGRPESEQGAHVRGHNENSLGICLVGGTDADDKLKAEFNYTLTQMIWLAHLLMQLEKRYPKAKLCGHRDLDPKKACPVFDVAAWWGSKKLKKV